MHSSVKNKIIANCKLQTIWREVQLQDVITKFNSIQFYCKTGMIERGQFYTVYSSHSHYVTDFAQC